MPNCPQISTWLTYDSVAFSYKAGSTVMLNLVIMKKSLIAEDAVNSRPSRFGMVIAEWGQESLKPFREREGTISLGYNKQKSFLSFVLNRLGDGLH